jgi:hypothetical protein
MQAHAPQMTQHFFMHSGLRKLGNSDHWIGRSILQLDP